MNPKETTVAATEAHAPPPAMRGMEVAMVYPYLVCLGEFNTFGPCGIVLNLLRRFSILVYITFV